MRKRPCRKVRANGIRGLLGAPSISKCVRYCTMCMKPCKWYMDVLTAFDIDGKCK